MLYSFPKAARFSYYINSAYFLTFIYLLDAQKRFMTHPQQKASEQLPLV